MERRCANRPRHARSVRVRPSECSFGLSPRETFLLLIGSCPGRNSAGDARPIESRSGPAPGSCWRCCCWQSRPCSQCRSCCCCCCSGTGATQSPRSRDVQKRTQCSCYGLPSIFSCPSSNAFSVSISKCNCGVSSIPFGRTAVK